MRQDERRAFVVGLDRARRAAFPTGEYVGQESFVTAGEVRDLAAAAGVGGGVPVLDVCCGTGGPGRLLTVELGCRYLGVDYSASALEIAAELGEGLPCRFSRGHVPPLPDGPFEVVLVVETMLAFADKQALAAEVARVLAPGGRFAFTVEEGLALTPAERTWMPDADTVHLVEMDDLEALLRRAGFEIRWERELTAAHQQTSGALLEAYRSDAAWISQHIGARALTDLIAAHELWWHWLGTGRVRKYAVVAERR